MSCKWFPFSSTAYGANAVYIPEWGEKKNLEFIMVMNQNYPEFKTHPVMDCFHGYIAGAERFDKNHDYRVVGWDIDLTQNFWSFIYLPTTENNVKAVVCMVTNKDGRLCIEIDMRNPSDENREWQFCFYITPGYGIELPGLKYDLRNNKNCSFEIDAMNMELSAEKMKLENISVCDSNAWINFPLNAEASYSSEDIVNRYKKRLVIAFEPITVPPHANMKTRLNVAPQKSMLKSRLPKISRPEISEEELPYKHALWEALHNRQYVKSDVRPNKMTARVIPGRQWYKFFMWDAGMTALGALEMDENFAEDIIHEMPDADLIDNVPFPAFGSLIITSAYALWELYQKTLNKDLLVRHYLKTKELLLKMYFHGSIPEYKGIIPTLHGSGADDNPASFYANGSIFAWDYKKTLPVNPDRKKKILLGVGMTCHAIRGLKILRNIAWILNKTEDCIYFSDLIKKSEDTLNNDCWDEVSGCYLDRIAGETELLKMLWIFDWLPLYSASVPDCKIKKMLSAIYDDNKYMTPHGLILVPRDSEYYRADGYPNGSAWPPLQYFFWKAAYNIGEMKLARILSEKWLKIYEDNHKKNLCCWEQYRSNTGKGAGNSRFSGFLTPVIALWASRRKFGRFQCSSDLLINSFSIAENGTNACFELSSPFFAGKTGFSIVLTPDSGYSVFVNDVSIGKFTTDRYGYMDFCLRITNTEGFSRSFSKMRIQRLEPSRGRFFNSQYSGMLNPEPQNSESCSSQY